VSSAQAIHCKLDMCCLQILRSLNGLVCYIWLPNGPVSSQTTVWSDTTIG
jgi:hypothetical protein